MLKWLKNHIINSNSFILESIVIIVIIIGTVTFHSYIK